MAFKLDEVYRCPEPSCGAELTVTKAAPTECTGTALPTCCCGRPMVKVSVDIGEQAERSRAAAEVRELELERDYGVITEEQFEEGTGRQPR